LRGYYWTWRQGEYATDILFRDPAALQEVYPRLVQHALHRFACRDVLRFLGPFPKNGFLAFLLKCHLKPALQIV
jgi:hypothetical protein